MSMSRRDFEAIAKIISELREDAIQVDTRDLTRWIDSNDLVNQLADYLLSQNPRFDYDRFYNACQVREYENDTSNSDCSVYPLV